MSVSEFSPYELLGRSACVEIAEAEQRRLIPPTVERCLTWSSADYLVMSDLMEEEGLPLAAEYFRRIAAGQYGGPACETS